MKGIDSLRDRLSKLLFRHLKHEIPILKAELDNIARATQAELNLMGKSRAVVRPISEFFLAQLFGTADDIVKIGVGGTYDNEYFGRVDIKAPITEDGNSHRLRSVVQHLNIRFSEYMSCYGHMYLYGEEGEAGYQATVVPKDPKRRIKQSSIRHPFDLIAMWQSSEMFKS